MKPLAPRTVATQKDHLRCVASALVRTGHDPSAIVDLAYLVQPAHVRQALTFFLDRNDGKPNAYVAAIAYTLRTVAKYGVDTAGCRPQGGRAALQEGGAAAPAA